MSPNFITFTGADDHTSIEGMHALARVYPIEWGILFSTKQQGTGRYPSFDFLNKLARSGPSRLCLSAHLCGSYSRSLIEFGYTGLENPIASFFVRAQINTSDSAVRPRRIRDWAARLNVTPILQCQAEFPADPAVQWLYDVSGGRGISPPKWLPSRDEGQYGYAGGLNPQNVSQAVASIGAIAKNYWIDMETGVRNEDDKFDLGLCRAVCEAVYGKRPDWDSL